jgi:hypothetical protein
MQTTKIIVNMVQEGRELEGQPHRAGKGGMKEPRFSYVQE